MLLSLPSVFYYHVKGWVTKGRNKAPVGSYWGRELLRGPVLTAHISESGIIPVTGTVCASCLSPTMCPASLDWTDLHKVLHGQVIWGAPNGPFMSWRCCLKNKHITNVVFLVEKKESVSFKIHYKAVFLPNSMGPHKSQKIKVCFKK